MAFTLKLTSSLPAFSNISVAFSVALLEGLFDVHEHHVNPPGLSSTVSPGLMVKPSLSGRIFITPSVIDIS
jgi:hypothetical protein